MNMVLRTSFCEVKPEYHLYAAIGDRKNISRGAYLAHNAVLQFELSRVETFISLLTGISHA